MLAVKGDCEKALAEQTEQIGVRRQLGEFDCVELRVTAQGCILIVTNQQTNCAIFGLRLQRQLPFGILQCRPEQGRQHQRLCQRFFDNRRQSMCRQNLVQNRIKPHEPTARIHRRDREAQGLISQYRRCLIHPNSPKHQSSTDFCACSRFSASSQITDCGPSSTPSVASSPRCAGRQWRNLALGLAPAISRSST